MIVVHGDDKVNSPFYRWYFIFQFLCYGLTTRTIGVMILVHDHDSNGSCGQSLACEMEYEIPTIKIYYIFIFIFSKKHGVVVLVISMHHDHDSNGACSKSLACEMVHHSICPKLMFVFPFTFQVRLYNRMRNPFLLFAHSALIRLSTNRLDESSSIHLFE